MARNTCIGWSRCCREDSASKCGVRAFLVRPIVREAATRSAYATGMTILPKRTPEHVPIARLGLIERKYFTEHRINAVLRTAWSLFRRCFRLQVVDDEFEQAHPVRLGRSMTFSRLWQCLRRSRICTMRAGSARIFQECDDVFRDFRNTFIRSGSTLPNQTAWSV